MESLLAVGTLGAAGVAAGAGARVLLGRLRRGTRVRPPVCEVAVGAAWAAVGGGWAAAVWPAPWAVVLLALTWFAVAAGMVDLRHHRLPDALTLAAVPVALVLVAPLGEAALGRAAVGALVACGTHAAVHLAAPGSLGAGDVKLAASLGAVLAAASWGAPLLAAALASVLTGGAALAVVVAGSGRPSPVCPPPTGRDPPHSRTGCGRPRSRLRGAPVPHGPSMLVASTLVLAVAAAA